MDRGTQHRSRAGSETSTHGSRDDNAERGSVGRAYQDFPQDARTEEELSEDGAAAETRIGMCGVVTQPRTVRFSSNAEDFEDKSATITGRSGVRSESEGRSDSPRMEDSSKDISEARERITIVQDDSNIEGSATSRKEGKKPEVAPKMEIQQSRKFVSESPAKNKTDRKGRRSHSQLPMGGWLFENIGSSGDPDDGSSGSSSDGDDREDKNRKNLRESTPYEGGETKSSSTGSSRVAKLKPPEPFVYDGIQDFDKFELWCFGVAKWVDITGIDERMALKYLSSYLAGKAGRFYMSHVARVQLRDRLLAMEQGNRSVRDFKRELERLGTWLSDVTGKDMAIQFWKGIHPYLRVELAGEDMDHENSSLEELTKYATRFENRENLRQEELRNMSGSQAGNWRRNYQPQRFDFEIKHIPGKENTVADALYHMYSNEQPGTVRTESKYVSETDNKEDGWGFNVPQRRDLSEAIYTGRVIKAEYALNLNTLKGSKMKKSDGLTSERSFWMNTRQTKRNNLLNMSGSEELVVRPAGSRVQIPELEGSSWKPRRVQNRQGELEKGIQRHVRQGSDAREAVAQTTDQPDILSGESLMAADKIGSSEYQAPNQNQGLTSSFNTITEVQIPQCLKEQYHSDEFFSKVIKDIGNYKNFEWEAGLLSLKTDGKALLCIPDVTIGGHKVMYFTG
ncbi:hypothetical protein M422DRAFT_261808 [Sphaerobolus stellatus SS14]|uniref:Uncharacterized protein n=1 Tax=Sphaerobolus stellatus (strain SS14) TaxID=990650 RepID=A0A0C9VEM0_SPHS4|nr:hypothetical protein M422DRAFT_261808 [Sphaerobolus stellatus SS14]